MMDCTDQTNSSAIQGEGYYFDRLFLDTSRESNSLSRSYYPISFPETVNFQWEKRPGLPKKLPGTDDVMNMIPLSPPPALHGLGLVLPRPDCDRSSHRWTARFWRRISNAAGKSCTSSSSSSADRRLASCSVPSSIDKSGTGGISSLSDLRQLYDGSDGAVAALAAGSSYSSFSSNSSLSANFRCGNKDTRRCSSAGESSRMYYSAGDGGKGVPFDWEMQPGKSKDHGDADEIEIIPPPTPPPAVQSRGLPMPRFDDTAVPELSSKAGNWKKVRLDSSSVVSCFKYRTGSERRLEEQPPFCCRLRP